MICRFCTQPLTREFLDLGSAPPSNAFLDAAALAAPEPWYPLRLHLCEHCLLVQIGAAPHLPAVFPADYVYYSSFSQSWLEHARRYVDEAIARLALGRESFVVELASNDGYLLQYVAAAGIRCLGIEPTQGTANAARARGVDTLEAFFGEALGRQLAAERGHADLLVANNVLAHVPDPNDFIAGIAALIAPRGVVTIEFPHLLRLLGERQFDTVYHEHFSYFSLHTVQRMLAAHGLAVHDVQELPTHGGSLRVWARPAGAGIAPTPAVAAVLAAEAAAGMLTPAGYAGFQQLADEVKNGLLRFLLDCRRDGLRVAGYGAAAKGNTLLNYGGVRPDLLPYVVDASPHKQGLHLPGSRIPVVAQSHLQADRPDIVLILPWNLRTEIEAQLAYVRDWGGRFATAVPRMSLW